MAMGNFEDLHYNTFTHIYITLVLHSYYTYVYIQLIWVRQIAMYICNAF